MTGTAPTRKDAFLSAVVLAAGASTRMGRPKQLLPLAGRTLLEHVLHAAASSRLDEIVLVLGHRAAEIAAAIELPARRPTRVVINPDHGAGQSTSLRLGLRSIDPRAGAAAVLLGDQPLITPRLIDRVAESFLAAALPAARPLWRDHMGGRVPGHPVFLARRVWPEIEKLGGDQGARSLFGARPELMLEVAIEGEPPVDIDEWTDYERAVDAARTATVGA